MLGRTSSPGRGERRRYFREEAPPHVLGRSLNPGNTAAPSLPGEEGRHMLLGSDHHGVVGAAANETATVGACPSPSTSPDSRPSWSAAVRRLTSLTFALHMLRQ